MELLEDIQAKLAINRIADFSEAWNHKELGVLSNYITTDIVFSNSPVQIGLFHLKGRTVYGKFALLKFWKKYLAKFENIMEEKVVRSIKEVNDDIVVSCDIHNYNLEVSCKADFFLNKKLQIHRIIFTNVSELKGDKPLSVVSLIMKQLRSKVLS